MGAKAPRDPISLSEFESLINKNNFSKRVMEDKLILPEFETTFSKFAEVFREIELDPKYNCGKVADYIPSLGKADPKGFAAAFCTADG